MLMRAASGKDPVRRAPDPWSAGHLFIVARGTELNATLLAFLPSLPRVDVELPFGFGAILTHTPGSGPSSRGMNVISCSHALADNPLDTAGGECILT